MTFLRIENDTSVETKEGKVIFVDAWETDNDNEQGKNIAKVIKKSNEEICVEYLDDRAKKDSYAQEVIQDSIKRLQEEVE